MLKPILTGLALLATLLLASCSDDRVAPTTPMLAALELETMPLSQGNTWTYSIYMTESSIRKPADKVKYNLTMTFGRLVLSVPREVGGRFTRSWRLESQTIIDSIRSEHYLDYDLMVSSLEVSPATYEQSFTIFLERDTLWYQETGKLFYMMPASLDLGGEVNLRLFDFHGTSFFHQPIPFHARWGGGDYIYLRQNELEKSAVIMNTPHGIRGIWASNRVKDYPLPGDTREQELRFTLREFTSPVLAP
jgi:hypothetical protein